jgi:hypothetical protein
MYGDTEFINENWKPWKWMASARHQPQSASPQSAWQRLWRLGRRAFSAPRLLIGTAYRERHSTRPIWRQPVALPPLPNIMRWLNKYAKPSAKPHVSPEGAVIGDIKSVHPHLVHLNMQLNGETQTNYALALNFDLIPTSTISYATDRLIRDIVRRGNHLSTGFVGTMHLPALTKGGATEMAIPPTPPAELSLVALPVAQGATTMWERWDSWHHEFGLQTPTMNSFNHFAYGCVGDWMMRTMIGICDHPDAPGFRTALIAPQPGGGRQLRQRQLYVTIRYLQIWLEDRRQSAPARREHPCRL